MKEIGDGVSPIFILKDSPNIFKTGPNMDAAKIIKEIEGAVIARGCFIVDLRISGDNDIELVIESEEGIVDMEDCVAVNNAFIEIFNRDEEDYSLTVSSAGLDKPFKILKQFKKAVGSPVEVKFKGGKKLVGILTGAEEAEIRLDYEEMEAVEGKKKKEKVKRSEVFPMTEINSVAPHIEFE